MLYFMKKIIIASLLICSLFLLAACGGDGPSTVVKNYAESVDGDLSNNRERPTRFEIGTGTTSLSGTVIGEDDNGDKDPDYFTITVPEGGVLSELVLTNFEADFDSGAFIAIVEGRTFSVEDLGNDTDATALLGYALFGGEELDENLLPLMVEGNRGGGEAPIGFDVPLPAGNYSFWVQQTGPETQYALQFRLDLAGPEEGVE